MNTAGLSIDMDSVASHLEGYGFPRPEDDGSAYTLALPRILELFARTGVRATFFLIANEARNHPSAVTRIVAEGHEVGSHSMDHRLPFSALDAAGRQREIFESRVLLEALTGQEVSGFRAPSWDAGPWLVEDVANAGYTYDSSAYPSILLPLLRIAVALRGGRGGHRASASAWSAALGRRGLHDIETRQGSLHEVPMYTVPGLRLPYYHTMRFVMPSWVFRGIRQLAQSTSRPVWYQFHAVDFLSLSSDNLDPRIGCHPGMRRPLDEKLELAADALHGLSRGRIVAPLRELATRFAREAPTLELARGRPM